LLSHNQNAGQIQDVKVAKGMSENVSYFTYLGMTVRNPNIIEEEIMRRLNSGNAWYHSAQILPFSWSAVEKRKH
jgi:hypothetical protein